MRALTCLPLVLLLALPAAAQEAAKPRPPTTEELDAQLGDWWYGIYVQGRKAGWGHISFTREGTPDAPVIVGRSDVRFEVVAMGERFSLEGQEEDVFDARPPHALLRSVERMKQGEDRMELRVAPLEGGGYTVTVSAQGAEHAVPMPGVEYGLADELAPGLWVLRGAKQGETLAYVSLNASEGELRRKTATLLEVETRRVEGVETRVCRLSTSDEREGEEGVAVVDARGLMLSAVMEDMFELRLEPEEVAKRLDVGGDLFVDGMARLDKKLGETETLKRVRLRVEGEARGELRAGPGQALEKDGDAVILVLDPLDGPRVAATPEEVERALRSTPDVPADHPEVVRLAKEAVGDAATPAAKVERLVHFVSEYVEDTYSANALSVHDIVRRKAGDCSEHAALFTAVARAAGIPARAVGGLGYMGDEEGIPPAFGGHAWNEVVLDGHWVPVDPTWDQVRADPGHIRLGHEGGEDVSGKVYGRLRFVLLSAE